MPAPPLLLIYGLPFFSPLDRVLDACTFCALEASNGVKQRKTRLASTTIKMSSTISPRLFSSSWDTLTTRAD